MPVRSNLSSPMASRQVGCISAAQFNDFILAVHFVILVLLDNKYIASAQLHNQTKEFHAAFSSATRNLPSRSSLDEHASSTTQSQL
jgi:hypothetical protein